MADLRQTSFASGELSPLLWGRTDLEHHAHGARTLLNFFVTRQGAAMSRPGSTKVAQATSSAALRLVPYIYSDGNAYLLELTDRLLRVLQLDGTVVTSLVTPYRYGHLFELQYAQAGADILFTHPSYAPQELRGPKLQLTGMTSAWEFGDFRFGPPGNTTSSPTSISAFFTKKDGSPAAEPLLTPRQPDAAHGGDVTTLFVTDSTHPPREWRYKVSAIAYNYLTGEYAETLAVDVTRYWDGVTSTSRSDIPEDSLLVLYSDSPIRLSFSYADIPVTGPSWWHMRGLVYYRGRGDVFGYIGTTRWAQDFVDLGDDPDYSVQPLRGDSPFDSRKWPAAVAIFQQRVALAGGTYEPSTIRTSALDDWGNWDRGANSRSATVHWPGEPLEWTFYGQRLESIKSMVAAGRLLVINDSGVWSWGGASGTMLDHDSIDGRREDSVGGTSVRPLTVDGAVLYVASQGRGVRALMPNQNGGYDGVDISWHAEHLFRGARKQVVDWCYQRYPWGVVWAVRADGVLLSCTRTGSGAWAWTRHDVGGVVRSVACLPDGNTEAVYVAVDRVYGTFIEKLVARGAQLNSAASPSITDGLSDTHDAFAVDSAVEDIGLTGGGAPIVVSNLAHLTGRQVYATAPGNAPQGPFTVAADGTVTIGPWQTANAEFFGIGDVTVFRVGLPFVADLELLDAPGLGQKTVRKVGFEVDSAVGIAAGQDLEHLVPWRQRDIADGYLYPSASSELVVVNVLGTWQRSGRAALRQELPAPVTVLGITREVVTGGS